MGLTLAYPKGYGRVGWQGVISPFTSGIGNLNGMGSLINIANGRDEDSGVQLWNI